MAFDRNYDELLVLAGEVGAYESGYLDTEGEKAALKARRAYATERDKVAYSILAEKPDLDLVYEGIRGDLSWAAEQAPEMDAVCTFVAEDLIDKLQEESEKNPLWRTVVRYGGTAVAAVLAIGYLGMFWYNDLTIDQPIDTKAGLIQHAAAYEKARTYHDWMSTRTRRGGALKGLLLWPWEPDDQEFEAAQAFTGFGIEGLEYLNEEGATCDYRFNTSSDEFSDRELELLDAVAAHVRAEDTVWDENAALTPLMMMADTYPCSLTSEQIEAARESAETMSGPN